MPNQPRFYFANRDASYRLLNRQDLLLLLMVFFILFGLCLVAAEMVTPYAIGQPLPISLLPSKLPFYALHTVLRLFVALIFSIIFTLVVGTLAAKNKRAERLIIPLIDILQSIPVLSFLAITATGFIALFPGSLLGPECACIFVIFTSQVWNITFSFYQSLKTLPDDLQEVATSFRLSAWQQFWKIEVPFAMPALLWNLMASMSASWFFVVLSESIYVSHQTIRLPGIGSYIALAIAQESLKSLGYAILTMIIVIFIYDQLLFRPLIAWSEKFQMEQNPNEETYQSWLIDFLRGSRMLRHTHAPARWLKYYFLNPPLHRLPLKIRNLRPHLPINPKRMDHLWNGIILGAIVLITYVLAHYILATLQLHEVFHALLLGSFTALRILILIFLSSLLWIPIGVFIGMRPRLAQRVQPIIQFAAAFPANLFYPLFVIAIVHFHLNVEIWITPLMILGTQWYILFNVIAGAARIPRELYLAAANFNVRGLQWWRTLILPGIFPYYITGAITAAGGAWNASIVAEWVSWGSTTLKATGLGEYIQANTIAGNFPKIALGTAIMCVYVLLFNHLIWRPLYRLAERKFKLE